jgi:uncharacterized coiled-coil protein SlyX
MAAQQEATDRRVTHLEEVVSHLEHALDQMHGVLLNVQAEVAGLKRMLGEFEARLEDQEQPPVAPRDPAIEKPPHY